MCPETFAVYVWRMFELLSLWLEVATEHTAPLLHRVLYKVSQANGEEKKKKNQKLVSLSERISSIFVVNFTTLKGLTLNRNRSQASDFEVECSLLLCNQISLSQ